jgi:hypothetical protein
VDDSVSRQSGRVLESTARGTEEVQGTTWGKDHGVASGTVGPWFQCL